MTTVQLNTATPELHAFLAACDKKGFANNNSLAAIKWEWCMETGGAWFATYKDDGSIVSVSGVHPFEDGYRALFRGAQLEPRLSGINKYHMQSYCFHSQLPHQISFVGNLPLYITTNVENDASGKMIRINNTFQLLEKIGLVSLVEQAPVFYVVQNIWKLNVEVYNHVRHRF